MAGKGSPKGVRQGGRKVGTPNKATSEIKAIAREYGPAAIAKLAELGGVVKGKKAADSEQAQTSALRELLDRGYGKPTQGVELAPTEGLEQLLDRIIGASTSSP